MQDLASHVSEPEQAAIVAELFGEHS